VVEVVMAVAIRIIDVPDTTLKTAVVVVLLPLLMCGLSPALLQGQPSLLPEFMLFLAEAMAEMAAETIRVVMGDTVLWADMALQFMYPTPPQS
jgi:hypothetical protein